MIEDPPKKIFTAGGTLNFDGGSLTLDGGTRPPYNLSTAYRAAFLKKARGGNACSYATDYKYEHERRKAEIANLPDHNTIFSPKILSNHNITRDNYKSSIQNNFQ